MTSASGISTDKRQSELADLDPSEPTDTPGGAPPEKVPKESKLKRRRSLWILIGILSGFVIYAYAFETTDVNLDKIKDETRQVQLVRVLRALARPDLLDYETVDTNVDLGYMIPCPAEGFSPAPIEGDTVLSVDPTCADPRAEVTVDGSGFLANEDVQIFFVPPNGTELRLTIVRTDGSGSFLEQVRLPNRPDEQIQTIRAETRLNVGSIFNPEYVEDEEGNTVRSPRWSQNAIDTLDKIIETVFLALLATTAGTIIAIPLSFFAAKNLMRDVRIPAIQLGFAAISIPFGVVFGLLALNWTSSLVAGLPESSLFHGGMTILLAWLTMRLLSLAVTAPEGPSRRVVRLGAGLAAALAILIAGQTLALFAELGGTWFATTFPGLAFLGDFVATLGEILAAAFGVLTAIAGAGLFGLLGSKLGYATSKRVSNSTRTLLTVLVMAIAGGLVAVAFGQVVAWLYQIEDLQTTVVIPFAVGALLGGFFSWRGLRTGSLGAGIGVYYASRTVSNTMRSIEPLVMAIVFVIWVGLGPFAGALALGLHTVASLTKLYSEQVESINTGPVEAVRATGATRLQTVVYGVVPQIVSPYISFTMYRWDINVRMSTIIGFVGGGGIGFLLQQNIRLLNYRGAAAQMLAIAIVVASMDYISSRLRERFV